MFACYYDTAGTESSRDKRILVTTGVAATTEEWAAFDGRWMAALREFGVTELHMRHYAHSVGQFTPWKGDEPKRQAFIRRLCEEARRGIQRAFVMTLMLADYDRINAEYELAERIGSPYALAQTFCLARSLQWLAETKAPDDGALFFVEAGDAGQATFLAHATRTLGWTPTPLPRWEPTTGEPYTPFQVADFIAYEHALAYDRALDAGNERPLRESFRQLRTMLPVDPGVYDEKALRAWCADVKIATRTTQRRPGP